MNKHFTLTLVLSLVSGLMGGQVSYGQNSLLAPFGYYLGEDKQTALKFSGNVDWRKAETASDFNSPVYVVRIRAIQTDELYQLVYWKEKLAEIERLGLFGDDNNTARNRYRSLFTDFKSSLRNLGFQGKVDYTEQFETKINQTKIQARFHPHQGARFDIAQYRYSIQDVRAATEIRSHQESVRQKSEEEKGRYTYSLIGCQKKLSRGDKFLEITVATRTPDIATCERVTSAKIAALRSSSFWDHIEGECDGRASTNSLFAGAFRNEPGLKLYLSFKDLDGFETRVNFMGATLPAARALADMVIPEYSKLGIQDIRIIEPAP